MDGKPSLSRERINDEAGALLLKWMMWPGHCPDFSVEEFWPDGADEPNLGNLRVPCLGCGRQIAPIGMPSLTPVQGGWRWVGLDHQEPYTTYFAACGWCGGPVLFTIHTPQ